MRIGFDTTNLVCREQGVYNEREIHMDQFGNKYYIGVFKGSTSLNGDIILTSPNIISSIGRGVFVVKYDSLNNYKWIKKIAESDSLVRFCSTIDAFGDLLLGFTFRGSIALQDDTIVSNGLADILLLKIDSSGNKKFHRLIYSNGYEDVRSLTVDLLGNIFTTGQLDVNNFCIVAFDNILISNNKLCYLAKYNALGQILWVRLYDVALFNKLYEYNNHIYILGECTHLNNSIDGYNINYPSGYFSKHFVSKLDSNGNCLWAKRFGSNDIQSAGVFSTTLVANKNLVFFSGGASSNNTNVFLFDGGPTLNGMPFSTGKDYFIACYDTNGNFRWNTVSQSYGSEALPGLVTDNSNNIYASGIFDYTLLFPTDTVYSYGNDDVLVCSYDSSGNFRWATNGGGVNADVGSGIGLDNQKKIYIVGGTTSPECYMGNDILYPTPGQSTMFFASIDSIAAPNAIHNIIKIEEGISLYPNPANDIISIKLEAGKNNLKKITIYNTFGQNVLTERNTTTINIANLSNGFYSIQCITDKAIFNKKIIIQHHSQ